MSSAAAPAAELLTIGELAKRTGKRASSIRYYESIGLLPEPERAGGRRRYAAEMVRTLAVVDTAQRGGLSLDEIKLLLDATPGSGAAVERLRGLAERKLPEIEALIVRTQLVQRWLESAAGCECPSLDECPLFDDEPCIAAPAKSARPLSPQAGATRPR